MLYYTSIAYIDFWNSLFTEITKTQLSVIHHIVPAKDFYIEKREVIESGYPYLKYYVLMNNSNNYYSLYKFYSNIRQRGGFSIEFASKKSPSRSRKFILRHLKCLTGKEMPHVNFAKIEHEGTICNNLKNLMSLDVGHIIPVKSYVMDKINVEHINFAKSTFNDSDMFYHFSMFYDGLTGRPELTMCLRVTINTQKFYPKTEKIIINHHLKSFMCIPPKY